jgi:hypothetical protein
MIMPKRSRKKKEPDINELAASIVSRATSGPTAPEKNPAAVSLGRLGGLKGGKARAAKLSSKQRHDIAVKAAKSRWNK